MRSCLCTAWWKKAAEVQGSIIFWVCLGSCHEVAEMCKHFRASGTSPRNTMVRQCGRTSLGFQVLGCEFKGQLSHLPALTNIRVTLGLSLLISKMGVIPTTDDCLVDYKIIPGTPCSEFSGPYQDISLCLHKLSPNKCRGPPPRGPHDNLLQQGWAELTKPLL